MAKSARRRLLWSPNPPKILFRRASLLPVGETRAVTGPHSSLGPARFPCGAKRRKWSFTGAPKSLIPPSPPSRLFHCFPEKEGGALQHAILCQGFCGPKLAQDSCLCGFQRRLVPSGRVSICGSFSGNRYVPREKGYQFVC